MIRDEALAAQMSETTTTCNLCKVSGLHWAFDWRKRKSFLVDADSCPHENECEYQKLDIHPTKCKYCKADNLLWMRKDKKWELIEEYGLPHACAEFSAYLVAWREAKRIDYAYEKARLTYIIPDNHVCKKCKGASYKFCAAKKNSYNIKRGVTKVGRLCLACKGVGTYTPRQKQDFLKRLRTRYWPFPSWKTS